MASAEVAIELDSHRALRQVFVGNTVGGSQVIDGLQIIQYDDGRYVLTIMEPRSPDARYWKIFEPEFTPLSEASRLAAKAKALDDR